MLYCTSNSTYESVLGVPYDYYTVRFLLPSSLKERADNKCMSFIFWLHENSLIETESQLMKASASKLTTSYQNVCKYRRAERSIYRCITGVIDCPHLLSLLDAVSGVSILYSVNRKPLCRGSQTV